MKLFNTLTRRKEEFVPLEEGKVRMYVCGPTVYNLIHIGNARPMIIFDTVRRYMEYKGYEEKLEKLQEKTGLSEAVITGKAKIDGREVVIGVCDGRFLMASMGWAVGEKITRAVERATKENGQQKKDFRSSYLPAPEGPACRRESSL